MLRIFNTLTRKVEEFEPIKPPYVNMYTCGPTVYDYMHIGNLRTFVLSDILFRTLDYDDFEVRSIQNITDIDDKIIKRAQEQHKTVSEIANQFIDFFLQDVDALNIPWKKNYDGEKIKHPSKINPRVSDYIDDVINFIKVLQAKGLTYERNGSVYFDISKFPSYGKLSGIKKNQLKTGTRTLSDEYAKDDVQDFALWKSVPEDGTERFNSPWGLGRPGWHIECSVMSMKALGVEQLDIHVGGIDLIFPHHENEIAQSEGATEKQFVKYWVHGAHILVNGQKMSKSLGNFFTLDDVRNKNIEPLALRYLYLQTHYRQEANFTWEALEGAQKALDRLKNDVQSYDEPKVGCAEFEQRFSDAINNDLNMPEALAIVWELVKSDYPSSAKAESLFKFDKVLGLDLSEVRIKKLEVGTEIPEDVQKMVKEREELRKQKRFHLADQMRNKIKKMGYILHDIEDGKTQIEKA